MNFVTYITADFVTANEKLDLYFLRKSIYQFATKLWNGDVFLSGGQKVLGWQRKCVHNRRKRNAREQTTTCHHAKPGGWGGADECCHIYPYVNKWYYVNKQRYVILWCVAVDCR